MIFSGSCGRCQLGGRRTKLRLPCRPARSVRREPRRSRRARSGRRGPGRLGARWRSRGGDGAGKGYGLAVAGEELLGLPGRLEPLHLPFSPSRRLVRDLGPVVQVSTLLILDPGQDLPLRRAVTLELVQDTFAIQVASSG